MLTSSFQQFARISKRREVELWRKGVLTWDDLERFSSRQLPLFGDLFSEVLRQSRDALARQDTDFFATQLPRAEHYRIALAFPQDTIFLDIETTGLSLFYDTLTFVGWSLGGVYRAFYRGCSEADLRRDMDRAKAVVTFNGSLFDLPFIRKTFPAIRIPKAHVDLRFLSRRAGIGGPQKDVEHRVGFSRDPQLVGMDGGDAVVLWHQYCRGDLDALRKLLTYNYSDVEGMKRILAECVKRIAIQQEWPCGHSLPTKIWDKPSTIDWQHENRGTISINPYRGRVGPTVYYSELTADTSLPPGRVVGIDLTGSEDKPSGWAILDGQAAETLLVRSDEEIVRRILEIRPDVVSIDSPLSLPKGRLRVDDSDPTRAQFGITRACERELRRRGINVYPCLIPSMQKLTSRGMRIAAALRSHGVPVIESYPGAAQDILGIPRKRASLEFLAAGLREFGLSGSWISTKVTHDELDAITSAMVGLFWLHGRFEALGNSDEDYLIIPQTCGESRWANRYAIGISGHIGSGKTTLAKRLAERTGWCYTRFSLILAELLRERGEETDRSSLQRIGLEIHRFPGQRWLCKRLVETSPPGISLVIDGLRHPEDHSTLVECFGPHFFHVHIVASAEERAMRLGISPEEMRELSAHEVESNVDCLSQLAHVCGSGRADALIERLDSGDYLRRMSLKCQSA